MYILLFTQTHFSVEDVCTYMTYFCIVLYIIYLVSILKFSYLQVFFQQNKIYFSYNQILIEQRKTVHTEIMIQEGLPQSESLDQQKLKYRLSKPYHSVIGSRICPDRFDYTFFFFQVHLFFFFNLLILLHQVLAVTRGIFLV